MIYVGIDPGYQHTGWCAVATASRNGFKILGHGVLSLPDGATWTAGFSTLLGKVLEEGVSPWGIVDGLGVELINWYGRRRGVLGLAHLAGACAALGIGRAKRVALFPAATVKRVSQRTTCPAGFSAHEHDALSLCRLLRHQRG